MAEAAMESEPQSRSSIIKPFIALLVLIALIALVVVRPRLYVPAPTTPLEMFYHSISEEMWTFRHEPTLPQPLVCVVIENAEWRQRFIDSIPMWLDSEPFQLQVSDSPIPPPTKGHFLVYQMIGWSDAGIVTVENSGLSAYSCQFTTEGRQYGAMVHWTGASSFYHKPKGVTGVVIPNLTPTLIPRSKYSPWVLLRGIRPMLPG
jgi:hypothetical protein